MRFICCRRPNQDLPELRPENSNLISLASRNTTHFSFLRGKEFIFVKTGEGIDFELVDLSSSSSCSSCAHCLVGDRTRLFSPSLAKSELD